MSAQFDWKNPDYAAVYAERAERLERIRANPEMLLGLRAHYADHIGEFINDWGVTSDPRNRNKGVPVESPFLLFGKQMEMVDFIAERMSNREPGLIEKSRDCGASWLAMCIAASLCLFGRGVVVGVGSRTEDKVDRTGDPDCLLWKARFFISHLPPEFRGGWDETKHSAHMRLQFPETGSAIVGEAGDAIGRGGRSTLYLIDEAAFIERPQLIEASLASNTDCRIDISTPNGRTNSFATKRHSGRIPVFTFRWLDDPRKHFPGSTWYEHMVDTLDPVTLAQEVDLSYDASTEGILIPREWALAAVDAHKKLGIEVSGAKYASLDVADQGKDHNCFAGRHGILLQHLKSWSGKGSDIFKTVVTTINLCDAHGYPGFDFDADGLGAGVRGDAVQINEKRRGAGKNEIQAEPFRGSASVTDPEGSLVEGRLNKDFFANLKAQSYWALHLKFRATYRAVIEGMPYNPDEIISLDSGLEELNNLIVEISQPTFEKNSVGKILINKTPEGSASPNLADALAIAFSPFHAPAYFSSATAPGASESAVAAKMPGMPKDRMDYCFAVVQFIEDTAGVVFVAANPPDYDGTRTFTCGGSFFVLDYDIGVLDAAAEDWLWSVERKLKAFQQQVCGGPQWGPPRLFCDDLQEAYAAVLTQRGMAVETVADLTPKTREQFPPIGARLKLARPYLNLGYVKIAPLARRAVTFRGMSRDFLREVLDSAEVPSSNPLAIALATAVLMNFRGETSLSSAQGVNPKDWPPRPLAAKPVPVQAPYVMLHPGTHTIDGHFVNVAGELGDMVMFPVSPGRHLIDSKITYAIIPGAGIPISATEIW